MKVSLNMNCCPGQTHISILELYPLLQGPEKYSECRNNVPRKADIWQDGRSFHHEEPGLQKDRDRGTTGHREGLSPIGRFG